MKTKKILSLVVAVAMMFAMGVNALATSAESSDASSAVHNVQYTGNTTVPTLNIVVTGTNSVLAFNPYKLAVKVDSNGVPDDNGQGTMDDQLISKPILITNLTNAPLKMEGSLKVSVDGGATLSNKAIGATETAKKIYCYADFYTYDDSDFSKLPELTKKATTAQRLVAQTAGTAVKHTAANRLTVQATDQTNPNYVFVKVSAEATKSPSPTAWDADDKITIDMCFTFTTDGNYDKYAVVVKGTNADEFTVTPVYSSSDMKVDAGTTNEDDITEGVEQKVVAGVTCVVTPAEDKKITAVKFYDKAGSKTVTTPKATATDTKDYTKPWTFTMPADDVVIEATTADA